GSMRGSHHLLASNGRVRSRSRRLVSQLLAKVGEARGGEAAEMDLTGAVSLGDLRLAELFEVAQEEDLTLTRTEVVEKTGNHLAIQHVVDGGLDRRVLPHALIERVRSVGVVGLECLDDRVLRNRHPLRDLADPRRAPQ